MPICEHKPYVAIHKIHRYCFGQTSILLGALDLENDREVAQIVGTIRHLHTVLENQAARERAGLQRLIAMAAPEIAALLDEGRAQIARGFERLEARTAALETARWGWRYEPALELYRELALVTAACYEQMDIQERRAVPVVVAAYGAETVFEAECNVLRQAGWQTMRRLLPLVLPILGRRERCDFVTVIAAAFPDTARPQRLIALAGESLDACALAALRDDLAVTVPERVADLGPRALRTTLPGRPLWRVS